MAYYSIFPEKDSTIYSNPDRTTLNTGNDEILELVKEKGDNNGIYYPSRILIQFKTSEINDIIKENDKILTIAAKDLEQTPTTSDRVLIASIEYQIIRINTDENDNENIKYEIYLRA